MADADESFLFNLAHLSAVTIRIQIDEGSAHAYYLLDGAIKGDVWLFNTREGHSNIALSDVTAEDFQAIWREGAGESEPPIALIYFRNGLHAVLAAAGDQGTVGTRRWRAPRHGRFPIGGARDA